MLTAIRVGHLGLACVAVVLWMRTSPSVTYALLEGMALLGGPEAATGWLGAYLLVHLAGLGLLAIVLGVSWPRSTDADGSVAPSGRAWPAVLGLSPVPASWLLAAGLAALGAGPLSSWLWHAAAGVVSGEPAGIEAIERQLASGSPLPVGLLVGWMVLAAPLVEEIAFRGYLWRAVDQLVGPAMAVVVSSIAFVAYHGDPLHSLAVVPLTVLLALTRSFAGSVWPTVALHAVNNLVSVGMVWAFGSFGALHPSAVAAFGSFLVALSVLVAVGQSLRRLQTNPGA